MPSSARAARADTLSINVDQAQIMHLPEKIATIVIGNPLIADATLQSGGILVVTGKGYGATNLLALDRSGRVVMEKTVQVLGAGSGDLVTVYQGCRTRIVQLRAQLRARALRLATPPALQRIRSRRAARVTAQASRPRRTSCPSDPTGLAKLNAVTAVPQTYWQEIDNAPLL